MDRLAYKRPSRSFFERHGRRGGQSRAKRLSSLQRSAIAARAARTRWSRTSVSVAPLRSVRLQQPLWDHATFLEEIISEGSLEDWKEIYRRITDKPFGPVAQALKKVLSSNPIYGVTPLWTGILRSLQGSPT